jgi:hypothetical protein
MGEVYRARDTRLGREVAVKVLPAASAADPQWRARFEREARAASALNHPNIVTLHDIGTEGDTFYIAMELVEGQTLRELLRPGPLPRKKLLELAVPIAEGLAQAHEAGIVHRDLKPENVMVSRDGRVKILDFGLSKIVEPPPEDVSEAPTLGERATRTGMVLGTVGYMSPEQAGGEVVDFRSDQFSFGAIVYEMATGHRAFQGATAAETLAALLRDEPPSLEQAGVNVPEGLRWIVERCLEKHREGRYGSTRDLAFDLRLLRDRSSGISRISGTGSLTGVPRRTRFRRALGVAGALALAMATFVAGLLLSGRSAARPPAFERLTFRRGTIWSARFAPDGQTVIYSASWEGHPVELFEARAGSTESRPLGLGAANVLSISSTGEMALSLDPGFFLPFAQPGTLARAPLTGGAPRELVRDVVSADWMPDGREFVFSRTVGGGRERLELSSGRMLYETPGEEVIGSIRVSPDGRRFAFFEYGETANVVTLSLQGERRVLSSGWDVSSFGLAWAPSGREVWFTAGRGEGTALHAVDLSGHDRLIARVPGGLELLDVFRDGRALLAHVQKRVGLVYVPPGSGRERDLSWRDHSFLGDLAPDGGTVAFQESSPTGGQSLYLRRTDGSPAVHLADGVDCCEAELSPDGQWVLSTSAPPGGQLLLLPTGPGPTRRLPLNKDGCGSARWLPDQSKVVFLGDEPGRSTAPYAAYVEDLASGAIRRLVSGLAYSGLAVAPDGRSVALVRADGGLALYAIDGSGSRVVARKFEGTLIDWSSDGRFLYSYRQGEVPGKVYRTEIKTGTSTVWKELIPADPAGIWRVNPVRVTPDGRSYAYTYVRQLSDLYVYEGLR